MKQMVLYSMSFMLRHVLRFNAKPWWLAVPIRQIQPTNKREESCPISSTFVGVVKDNRVSRSTCFIDVWTPDVPAARALVVRNI